MIKATREDCEAALHRLFQAHGSSIDQETLTALHASLDRYVDCVREEGLSPEAMVVAIKAILKHAADQPLIRGAGKEEVSQVTLRFDRLVSRAIKRYFVHPEGDPSNR